jgi:hypothetical protein
MPRSHITTQKEFDNLYVSAWHRKRLGKRNKKGKKKKYDVSSRAKSRGPYTKKPRPYTMKKPRPKSRGPYTMKKKPRKKYTKKKT